MIVDINQLLFENGRYKDPNHKIRSMVKKGELVPVKRGMYETDQNTPGYVLAYEIMGPSYLTFEYALAWYGMIPERVSTYTSAVCRKGKQLTFSNEFGVYTYRDIPEKAFPLYYTRELAGGRPFFIATKEKALCDQLAKSPPMRALGAFEEYLFDGLRIDEEEFDKLDFERISRVAPLYRRTNLYQLIKLVKRRTTRDE